jgi:murein DD-endopeptidase MepM/ murein hydrolase activator NlpD
MQIFKCRNFRFIAHIAFYLFWASSVFPLFSLEHVVQKGDTLYSLSRTYGLSVDEICKANKIENASEVKAGRRLFIPDTVKYEVKKGDTFWSIAQTNGMSVDELRKLNALDESTVLKAGQILKITPPATASLTHSATAPVVANTQKSTAATTATTTTSIKWPVQTSSVTYVNGKISGVQLIAKENESVLAINSGTVVYSGIYRGFGNVVFVQNKNGYMYVYTGMANLNVAPGAQIISGDVLGNVGVDTSSGKSQLTLMVYQNGKAVDPASAPRN